MTRRPLVSHCHVRCRGQVVRLGALTLTAFLWTSTVAGQEGSQSSAQPDPRIDTIFAAYDKKDSPGCAVAVLRDGRVAYARGYGMASLEHAVPITPATVFDIGSTSKQFTAMSVLLLAHDGKLSLDDDIRKYVPELPDLAHRITIRHILTHTSGLRDYTNLMPLAGYQIEEVTGTKEALASLVRQRALNFKPGDEWAYSNTGYFLASLIVERVAGTSMREFARGRLFTPLGMTNSRFFDDHTEVIPRRAAAYAPRAGGGFRIDMSNWEQTGDGGVQTSVEDLARWDDNFYSGRVGGRQLLELLETPARLNDGTVLDYALGLRVDDYRGLKRVSHGGAWGGYRAELMRFPTQRFSVAALCNLATTNPTMLAQRVSDVLLAPALAPPRVASASGSSKSDASSSSRGASASESLVRLAGVYWNPRSGAVRRIIAEGSGVFMLGGGPRARLVPLGGGRVAREGSDAVFAIHEPAAGEPRRLATGTGTGRAVFELVADTVPGASLDAFAGTYRSEEIGTTWTVRLADGKLAVHPARGEPMRLSPLFADAFSSDAGPIRFLRDASGRVTALSLTSRGVRDLRLGRVGW